VESPALRAELRDSVSAHHRSAFGVWPGPSAALAPVLPCAAGMTDRAFRQPAQDHESSRTGVDERADGRGRIDGATLFGALDPAFLADPYPVYAPTDLPRRVVDM